jgi:hypothetical protein
VGTGNLNSLHYRAGGRTLTQEFWLVWKERKKERKKEEEKKGTGTILAEIL